MSGVNLTTAAPAGAATSGVVSYSSVYQSHTRLISTPSTLHSDRRQAIAAVTFVTNEDEAMRKLLAAYPAEPERVDSPDWIKDESLGVGGVSMSTSSNNLNANNSHSLNNNSNSNNEEDMHRWVPGTNKYEEKLVLIKTL